MRDIKYNEMRFLRFLRSVEMTAVILLLVLLTACKKYDLLSIFGSFSEAPDERFAMSMDYNRQHGYDKIFVDEDDYKLYVMTDVHVDYSTSNLDVYIVDYLEDTTAAPFSLCLGDLVYEKGHLGYVYEHVKPVSDAGRKIYYTVGNHDLYFDQWKEYFEKFGSSTYWFEVQTVSGFKDLYISIDSGNGTLGVDQREWLEKILKDSENQGFRHKIVFTHTNFFKKDNSQGLDSNFNLEETYDLADLFARHGVDMVLQGHSHYRDLTVFKGVSYLRLDALGDHFEEAFYTIFSIGNEINYEFIKVK